MTLKQRLATTQELFDSLIDLTIFSYILIFMSLVFLLIYIITDITRIGILSITFMILAQSNLITKEVRASRI